MLYGGYKESINRDLSKEYEYCLHQTCLLEGLVAIHTLVSNGQGNTHFDAIIFIYWPLYLLFLGKCRMTTGTSMINKLSAISMATNVLPTYEFVQMILILLNIFS